MLIKSSFILLRKVNFGEKDAILYLYTRERGKMTVIVKNLKSKNKEISPSLIRPLMLFDGVLYQKPSGQMGYIREANPLDLLNGIATDPTRTSVSFFIAEVLYSALREEESQPALFDFLQQKILEMDATDSKLRFFHLKWLLQLSKYLGFFPGTSPFDPPFYFDLKSGDYSPHKMNFPLVLSASTSACWSWLCGGDDSPPDPVYTTSAVREELNQAICDYFAIHLEGFQIPKSLDILSALSDR